MARPLLLLLAGAGALRGAAAVWLDAGGLEGAAVNQLLDAGGGSRKRLGLLRRGRLRAPTGSMEGDSCFEANAKSPAIAAVLARKQELFDVYQSIFSDCGSGQYNMACVTNSFFADRPKEYLPFCQMSMGPQPDASGTICLYAKARRDELFKDVNNYGLMTSMMSSAAQNCKLVPLQCIMLAEECLANSDVRWCFNRCIRTGSMAHIMDTTTMPPRAGMTAMPPVTTALPQTTNLFIAVVTTTLGFWDSIINQVDDALT
mmetsp:Transcript_53339/g.140655  ORF Transcript_53339/g.140655 Transcript_53339/m.140655 type:complete len:259 (+) Transcript_53339:132-908(+)